MRYNSGTSSLCESVDTEKFPARLKSGSNVLQIVLLFISSCFALLSRYNSLFDDWSDSILIRMVFNLEHLGIVLKFVVMVFYCAIVPYSFISVNISILSYTKNSTIACRL